MHRWRYDEAVAPTGIWLPHDSIARRTPSQREVWNILVATGDPSANRNRFDREIAFIRDALGGISMIERSSVSVHALTTHLGQVSPTVLHICAHASDGQVALHADGGINWVPFALIADALLLVKAPPRLLVLNMCNGTGLATMLRTWASTTVSWLGAIDDDAARSFSGSFYRGLRDGASVHAAATSARADAPQLLDQPPRIHGNHDLVLTPRAPADQLGGGIPGG
ncbi:MAG TPA: hypothetical protein PKE40_14385 [Arachnia sp.]|nr:hypothetical protein [Arachnia sp.]HMT87532.1 hypothetical protein [Arachnia sp.]